MLRACLKLSVAFVFMYAASSVAQPTEHELLARELLQRWEDTKLPSFLAKKKAQIDEVMELGGSIDEPLLREILESDGNTQIRKNSELVDPKIYSSLQTQFGMKHLMENLKAGRLRPRANFKRFSRSGIYLELHLRANPKPFDWGDVEFHFDYSLLDETHYHINPEWSYGNYSPNSASPAVNMGRTNYFIRKYLTLGEQNEIVFSRPIPLTKLVKIVVPTGEKEKILASVKKAKLKCPAPMGWDRLLVEQEMPKQKPNEPYPGDRLSD